MKNTTFTLRDFLDFVSAINQFHRDSNIFVVVNNTDKFCFKSKKEAKLKIYNIVGFHVDSIDIF